jgi:menaquinone-9 beta-reductase
MHSIQNPIPTQDWDAAIIGGGLAGCAAAIPLAQAGKRVILLEKTRQAHHKVCGEFLSVEAVYYLEALGVHLPALHAVPIHTMILSAANRQTTVTLPFKAMSVSRYALDNALLYAAEQAGVTVCRGVSVNRIREHTLVLDTGHTIQAHHVAMGNGKTPVLGQTMRQGQFNDFIGIKMHYHSNQPVDHTVKVLLFTNAFGSYGGIEPVEHQVINVCLAIHKRLFKACDFKWPVLLQWLQHNNPVLRHGLAKATPCWANPLTVANIPYGFVYHPDGTETVYRLGDQLAVIPSFCGDGMAMALHTGYKAAQFMNNDHIADYYQAVIPPIKKQVQLACRLFSAYQWYPFPTNLVYGLRYCPQLLQILANQTRLHQFDAMTI